MRIIKAELKKVKSLNIERMKNKKLEEMNKNTIEYSKLIKTILDNEGIENAFKKKQEYIRSIRDMLETIQEMNLVEYIEHLKEIADENKNKITEEPKEKDEDLVLLNKIVLHDQKTVDEQIDSIFIEQKITELINMKNIDKHIRYKIRF
jgi:hypothetical protein